MKIVCCANLLRTLVVHVVRLDLAGCITLRTLGHTHCARWPCSLKSICAFVCWFVILFKFGTWVTFAQPFFIYFWILIRQISCRKVCHIRGFSADVTMLIQKQCRDVVTANWKAIRHAAISGSGTFCSDAIALNLGSFSANLLEFSPPNPTILTVSKAETYTQTTRKPRKHYAKPRQQGAKPRNKCE